MEQWALGEKPEALVKVLLRAERTDRRGLSDKGCWQMEPFRLSSRQLQQARLSSANDTPLHFTLP